MKRFVIGSKGKRAKYGNIKTNGRDSKFEYKRKLELEMMEKAGLISNLEVEVERIELQPKFLYNGDLVRKITYKPDFKYYSHELGKTVYEDVKSLITVKDKAYIIKSKLFKYLIKDREDVVFIEHLSEPKAKKK